MVYARSRIDLYGSDRLHRGYYEQCCDLLRVDVDFLVVASLLVSVRYGSLVYGAGT